MFCHQCGTKVRDDAAFCANCGTKFVVPAGKVVSDEQPAVTIEEVKAEQVVVASPVTVEEPEVEVIKGSYSAAAPAPKPTPAPKPAPAPVRKPAPAPVRKPAPVPVATPKPAPVRKPAPVPVAAPAPAQPVQAAAPAQAMVDSTQKPMTLLGWIGTFLLMMIPIAGFVLMFIWAFGSETNRSKKTYFQAVLVLTLIGIILSIVFGSALALLFGSLSEGVLNNL